MYKHNNKLLLFSTNKPTKKGNNFCTHIQLYTFHYRIICTNNAFFILLSGKHVSAYCYHHTKIRD
jgi:hypothetical protein